MLNPFEPAYYSNRAFAYIKTESYGYAILDADKAIDLDKNYVKVWIVFHLPPMIFLLTSLPPPLSC